MRRKLFNVAVGLSLVLWLVTTVLWFRAHFIQDVISVSGAGERLIRVHIKENGVVITSIAPWPRHEPLTWRWDWTGKSGYGIPVMFDNKTMVSGSILPGISYNKGTGTITEPSWPSAPTTPVRGRIVVIIWPWPLAISLAFAGPLVGIAARRWVVRRQRRAKGLCLACGYDLRASRDRCPECGNIDVTRANAQPHT